MIPVIFVGTHKDTAIVNVYWLSGNSCSQRDIISFWCDWDFRVLVRRCGAFHNGLVVVTRLLEHFVKPTNIPMLFVC